MCHPQGELRLGLPRHKSRGFVPRPLAGGGGSAACPDVHPRQLSPLAGGSPATELCCLLNHYWRQHSKRIINFRNLAFCVPYIVLTTLTLHFYQSQSHSSFCYVCLLSGKQNWSRSCCFYCLCSPSLSHVRFPLLINYMSEQNLLNNSFSFSGRILRIREMSWQNSCSN